MNLLEITASTRVEGSVSRSLSRQFINAWLENHPDTYHSFRDVGVNPPAHLNARFLEAMTTQSSEQTPEMVEILAESNALVKELLAADRIVIATPMYNFSIPSTLKAYIDNVVRSGLTFGYDPETAGFTGLAKGKRALVILSAGGNYFGDSPAAVMDYATTYLKTILGFIGITDVTVVTVPSQAGPKDVREQTTARAADQLLSLATAW